MPIAEVAQNNYYTQYQLNNDLASDALMGQSIKESLQKPQSAIGHETLLEGHGAPVVYAPQNS